MVVRFHVLPRRGNNNNINGTETAEYTTSNNNNSRLVRQRRYFFGMGLLIGMIIMSLISEFLNGNGKNNIHYIKNNGISFTSSTSSTTKLTKNGLTTAQKNNVDQQQQQQNRIYDYFTKYHYVQPIPKDHLGQNKKFPNHYPSKECGSGSDDQQQQDFEDFFRLDQNQRSRLNEDRIIYEKIFKRHKNATGPSYTFLELGAFNGAKESNTMFFEKCLGWEGLLIEGNPINYQAVLQNRPYAHKMSFAPSCLESSSSNNNNNQTTTSYVDFYRYPMTNVGLVGHAKTYVGKPTVNVPCGPLGPVIQDIFGLILLNTQTTTDVESDNNNIVNNNDQNNNNKPTLHFFSLDVEGAEYLVLQTIDFTKINIWILMIEIQNNDCQSNKYCEVRKNVRNFMSNEQNYLRYENLVHASDIYVHPNSPYQIIS